VFMMMGQKISLGPRLAGLALSLAPALADACSVCLTGEGDPSANAFNWSVLFLMATPYAVVGSIAGWLFYRHRRAAAKPIQDGERETVLHLTWNEEESGR
jgi:hypothetical protein